MLGKRLTARGISLEGAALGAALAIAVPAFFTNKFIQSTQAAVIGLNYAGPMAGFGAAGLPENFAAVVAVVNQVGASMARQRLRMATLAMAAGVSLLGGAAEAVQYLPPSLRPNLNFLAPSTLIKNLLTPDFGTPRLQAEPAKPVAVAVATPRDDAPAVVVVPATAATFAAATNQPILALQWTPAPQPPAASNAAAALVMPTLQLSTPAPVRAVAMTTLANTAQAAAVPPRRPTPAIDSGFRHATGGVAPAPAADTPDAPTPDRPAGLRPSNGPEVPPPPPADGPKRRPNTNLPLVRPVPNFEAIAVGGAMHDKVHAIAHLPGVVPGPTQLPADATFVPDSVVLRHGDVFVPGDGKYAWSDRVAGIAQNGANAADLTFNDVATGGGVLSIERAPVTSTLVPARPAGHHFVGIWAMNTTFDYADVNIVAHYDAAFVQAQALPEEVLKLWVYDDARADGDRWFRVMDSSFARDLTNHTVRGTYVGRPQFFAVSAPEPAMLGTLAVASGLLLRRRRRCI